MIRSYSMQTLSLVSSSLPGPGLVLVSWSALHMVLLAPDHIDAALVFVLVLQVATLAHVEKVASAMPRQTLKLIAALRRSRVAVRFHRPGVATVPNSAPFDRSVVVLFLLSLCP